MELEASDRLEGTFRDLQLSDPILHAIEKVGYSTPTPIQSRTIPLLLVGAYLALVSLLASCVAPTAPEASCVVPTAPLAICVEPTAPLAICDEPTEFAANCDDVMPPAVMENVLPDSVRPVPAA